MNILVIGGTRLIGKHLVSQLISKGYQVTIASRGIAKDDFKNTAKKLVINRLDETNLKETFSNQYYDVVYDSLAYCSNDIKRLHDYISCKQYITISTAAVYNTHMDMVEEDFNPLEKKLIWCERSDYTYDEVKRQAECALFQEYPCIHSVAVRFPFVIGKDDYTKRLYFYVEHIVNQKPMYVDNYDKQLAFVRSDEAGKFLAHFAASKYSGPINGASSGTISIKEISDYIEYKTGKKAILSSEGEIGPYNGHNEHSVNTNKANQIGFQFSPLKTWIYDLIDNYITDAV